jgi:hypothetical protein
MIVKFYSFLLYCFFVSLTLLWNHLSEYTWVQLRGECHVIFKLVTHGSCLPIGSHAPSLSLFFSFLFFSCLTQDN